MTVQNHLKYISIFGEWSKVFNPIINNGYFTQLINFLDSEFKDKNKIIRPSKNNVFKIFRLLDPDSVKIIILGGEPYPNKNATGIAFGNDDSSLVNFKMSSSLRVIFNKIEDTSYKKTLLFNFNYELKHLVNQGVLLINSSMTTEEGKTEAHYKQWAKFTKCILDYFINTNKNIIYCLWGNQAKSFKQFIKTSKFVLEADYPFYANNLNKKWDCNHFNQINAILDSFGKESINWGNQHE